MILLFFILVVGLSVYLEMRVNYLTHLIPWKRILVIFFSLLIIALLGILPKILNGAYEPVYIMNYILLLTIFIAVAKIDFEEKTVPNEIVCLVLTMNCLFLVLEIGSDLSNSRQILLSSLLGFLSGGGIFIFVNLFQKNGVGGGDIKLFAVLGISLGFVGIISICLNTFMLAAITSVVLLWLKKINKGGRIPLVPFILLSVLIYG